MKIRVLSILFISFFITICSANEWKIQNDPYYKHKVSQFEILKTSSTATIMMLGDSITDEGRWSELFGEIVENRGISGDTTSGVINRLYTTSPSIKKVFILIGVNDIMRGASSDLVFENYKKIINFFQEKNIEIFIQSTLYIGESRKEDFNQKIEKLNQKLEDYTKENRIVYINLNQYFSKQKTLLKAFSYDDLHLNGNAYIIWANEIKKY